MWGCGLDRAGSGSIRVAGTCECGNEHFRVIKSRRMRWAGHVAFIGER